MKVVVLHMTVCAQMIDHLVFITGMIYFHQRDIIHRDLKSRNGEYIPDTSFITHVSWLLSDTKICTLREKLYHK